MQRSGVHETSFTSHLLETPDLTPEREFDIKWVGLFFGLQSISDVDQIAASLYSGGADTVSTNSTQDGPT